MFEIIDFKKENDKPLTELKIHYKDKAIDIIIDCSTFKKAKDYDNYSDTYEEAINDLYNVIKWYDYFILEFDCGDCDTLIIITDPITEITQILTWSEKMCIIYTNDNYVVVTDDGNKTIYWFDKNLNSDETGLCSDNNKLSEYFENIMGGTHDRCILTNDNYICDKFIKIDFLNGEIDWLYHNKFEILNFSKEDEKPLTELKIRYQDKNINIIIDCSSFKHATNYSGYDAFEQGVNKLEKIYRWNDYYILQFDRGDCETFVILANPKTNFSKCLTHSLSFGGIFINKNYVVIIDRYYSEIYWTDINIKSDGYDLSQIQFNDNSLEKYFEAESMDGILSDDNCLYDNYIKMDFLNKKVDWLYHNKFEIINYDDNKNLLDLKIHYQDKDIDIIIDCSRFKREIEEYDVCEDALNSPIMNIVSINRWDNYYILVFNSKIRENIIVITDLKQMTHLLCCPRGKYILLTNATYIVFIDFYMSYICWFDSGLDENTLDLGKINYINNDYEDSIDIDNELENIFYEYGNKLYDDENYKNKWNLTEDNHIHVDEIELDFINNNIIWSEIL